MKRTFLALDFETANHKPQSACAIGVVRVEDDQVVAQESRLIRPPSRFFAFTDIHGITWDDVKDAPRFADVWHELQPLFDGATFIAAHNAGFDRGCCGPVWKTLGCAQTAVCLHDTWRGEAFRDLSDGACGGRRPR
ncbi:MAG: exonuclease domain-containing protein [Polyangia bacterium]